MDNLFVQRNAKLGDELEQLFVSLFTNHQDCLRIVRLLANRKSGYTRKEIAENTGVPYGGGLTKTLKALAESDFIQKYIYYGQPAKEERFRLIDFYSLFSFDGGQQEGVARCGCVEGTIRQADDGCLVWLCL